MSQPAPSSPLPEPGGLFRPRQIELLDRLEQMFMAQGYRVWTMDAIAQELRCSKRTLYEIAPNRKALFLCVVGRWAERIRTLADRAAARLDDPHERLAAYVEPGVTQSRDMTDAFLGDLRGHPEARALLEAHQRLRMAGIGGIIEEGIRRGCFADVHPRMMAGIYLATTERINDPSFLKDVGLSFSDAFAELYHILMHGLERS